MGEDDKAVCITELRRQFTSGRPFDLGEWYIDRYERQTDPAKRDEVLGALWNWSLSQPWAWNTLMELCRRTRIGAKQPAILVDFAMFAATGKRRPPNSGQGRNFISVNENLQILIAVRVLVKDYEFSKRAAYETVSDWLKEADWCSALSADAVRKRVRRMEKARPFPKGGDTNPP